MQSPESLGSSEVQSPLLEAVVDGKFRKFIDHVETYEGDDGQIFEDLLLNNSLHLTREVTGGDSRGTVVICYIRKVFPHGFKTTESVSYAENELVYRCDGFGHKAGEKVRPLRQSIIFARVLAGKPDLQEYEDSNDEEEYDDDFVVGNFENTSNFFDDDYFEDED